MPTSTPPLGGRPEPAPPALPLSAGGDDDDDHDAFSPLLDLLQRFPGLFEKYVLEHLDPTARASLARTGIAFWDLVFPRSIFPFSLLRAETPAAGAARVFKLEDFLIRRAGAGLGEDERVPVELADLCSRRGGRKPGGVEVDARARLPVERGVMHTRRSGRAPGRVEVGAGARLPVGLPDVCMAARGGHLEVLQWARQHGCPWNEGTSQAAAMGGHLAVLQWAREHDCPWDPGTCYHAALGGHLSLLQWARAHGCPWIKRDCDDASRNHPETLAWVPQQPE